MHIIPHIAFPNLEEVMIISPSVYDRMNAHRRAMGTAYLSLSDAARNRDAIRVALAAQRLYCASSRFVMDREPFSATKLTEAADFAFKSAIAASITGEIAERVGHTSRYVIV